MDQDYIVVSDLVLKSIRVHLAGRKFTVTFQ